MSRAFSTATRRGGETHARTATPPARRLPPGPTRPRRGDAASAARGIPARSRAGDRRRGRPDPPPQGRQDGDRERLRTGSEAAPSLRRGFRYPHCTTFHRLGEMGARRPFFVRSVFWAVPGFSLAPRNNSRREAMDVYTRERRLGQELTSRIEGHVPGTEVLAVELLGPDRFCVYIDHPEGVDHALCERVTREIDDYRREYTIDVSSPGLERPLRKRQHFAGAVGRRVRLKTASRAKVRGEVFSADDQIVRVGAEGGDAISIPYDQIVRGNLIDEGSR